MFDDQMVAVRDYLNEGGKVLVTGQRALQGAWQAYAYNPLGRVPDRPQCPGNTSQGDPAGQIENCVQVSDDFLQYWLGAFSRATQASNEPAVSALTLVGQGPFTSSFSLSGQAFLPRFTPTSTALGATFGHFAGGPTHLVNGTTQAVGVSTPDSLLWGFGLENVPSRATRAELMRQGLGQLGVDPYTQTTLTAGGTVPATLSLTLGPAASFGAFVPAVAREYTATVAASVVSTAGDAALTVIDPSSNHTGHLVNGAFVLPQPLQGLGTVKTWSGPTSNESVPVTFRQAIGASDPLRAGSYSKTLTFTLSTTNP
jgi:hypothetical protein